VILKILKNHRCIRLPKWFKGSRSNVFGVRNPSNISL
jgi:hypothetical protein